MCNAQFCLSGLRGKALLPCSEASTHLHGVRLASACLPIGEDADIEAIDAGGDQRLHLLEHLCWEHGVEGE